MTIFLTVLKIIGIVLASILGLLLLILLLVCFYPFGYVIKADNRGEFKAKAVVHWFLHVLHVTVDYGLKSELTVVARVCGIKVYKRPDKNKKSDDDTEFISSDDFEEYEPEVTSESTDEPKTSDVAEKDKPSESIKKQKDQKKKKRRKIKKPTFIEWMEHFFDKLEDLLTDIPFNADEFAEKAASKVDEYIGLYDYYDRILNSKGTAETVEMLKKRLAGILKPLIPKRFDASIDFASDDPATVALMYQTYAVCLPFTERIKGRITLDAVQDDESKVEADAVIKGRFILWPILWHGLFLYKDKKLRKLIRLLKREDKQ